MRSDDDSASLNGSMRYGDDSKDDDSFAFDDGNASDFKSGDRGDGRVHNNRFDEAFDASGSSIMTTSFSGTPSRERGTPGGSFGRSGGGDDFKSSTPDAASGGGASGLVRNRPYDEAVSLEDLGDETELSVDTTVGDASFGARRSRSAGSGGVGSRGDTPPSASTTREIDGADYGDGDPGYGRGGRRGGAGRSSSPLSVESPVSNASPGGRDAPLGSMGALGGTADADGVGSVDVGGVVSGEAQPYDASRYANLARDIDPSYAQLFKFIGAYKPEDVMLETKLRPFIPDYLPAIGEMDAFLKVTKPDGKPDRLGLDVLDEPAAVQTDSTVLELQLRATARVANLGKMRVRSIDNAQQHPAEITKWIQSIEDLHRSKPPPTVHYRRAMPDIEELMQQWPADLENVLKSGALPPPEIDMSLDECVVAFAQCRPPERVRARALTTSSLTAPARPSRLAASSPSCTHASAARLCRYARMVCALIGVPVYNSAVESLHVVFTLFAEFKANQHFQAMEAAQQHAAHNLDEQAQRASAFGGK
jgi:intraflagellar transport protein 46